MTISELMDAIAKVLNANKSKLGIEGAHYPPLNYIPNSPVVMVRQSLYQPTTITKERAGQQVVRPMIDLVALVKSDITRPGDASRLDGLEHPMLDLFDANANGGDVNHAFNGHLTKNVNRVWQEAVSRRAVMEWGESGYCHALILTMDAEFYRKAVLPT